MDRLISFSPELSDQPGSFPIEKPPDHQHPPEDSLDLLGTSVMAMTAQGEGEGTDDIVVSTGFGFSPHPDSMMSIQDSSLPDTLQPKLQNFTLEGQLGLETIFIGNKHIMSQIRKIDAEDAVVVELKHVCPRDRN